MMDQNDAHELQKMSGQKTAIIILGASGDLAQRKIYPALYRLFGKGLLGNNTIQTIIGFGRSSIPSFSERIRPYILKKKNHEDNDNAAGIFLQLCQYQQGRDYQDVFAFQKMRQEIISHDDNPRHLLVYFAIPPQLYVAAAEAVRKVFSSMVQNISMVLEKPFGRDLISYQSLAQELDSIQKNTNENIQLYCMDHYLGKSMVRYLLSKRFQQQQQLRLNKDSIEKVQIIFKETLDTQGRGGYFDPYGIIRDVIQNHLLQLLTIVAMDHNTDVSDGDTIRDSKVKVLQAINPTKIDSVIGQYDGYTQEKHVPPDSKTPTYAIVQLFLDNERWQGVPFVLVAGKALNENLVEIRFQLRSEKKNEYVIRIQPDRGFRCYTSSSSNTRSKTTTTIRQMSRIMIQREDDDAYATLLLEVLQQQQGLSSSFVRSDELEKSWEILTPLLERLERVHPYSYAKQSAGPKEALRLFPEMMRTGDSKNMRSKL